MLNTWLFISFLLYKKAQFSFDFYGDAKVFLNIKKGK